MITAQVKAIAAPKQPAPATATLVEVEAVVDEQLLSHAFVSRARRHLVGLYVCPGARGSRGLRVGGGDTALSLPSSKSVDAAPPLRFTVTRSEPPGRVVRVGRDTRAGRRCRNQETGGVDAAATTRIVIWRRD